MTLFEEIKNLFLQLLDILQFTGSWTETLLNVTLLLTAIYTFFFLVYIPILYPLRRLFRPMGIPISETSAIAWKCRKQPALFLRFYIETVIINGATTHMTRSRWRELRRIFEAGLSEYNRSGRFIVHSHSISDIISEEKKELVCRYFDLCTIKEKRTSANFLWQRHLRRNKDFAPEAFASVLAISNGFLAPMTRITGLNDRFEQNWQSIISNYLRMTSSPATRIPSAAASLTYTWLMWGPSVQIASENDPASDTNDGLKSLGIYGCGDEANSVHVVIPPHIRRELLENRSICMECTVIGRLRNPLCHIKAARLEFDPLSRTFLDRIYYSYQASPEYIVDIERIESSERTPHQGHPGYFTAYIWALFNLQPASSEQPRFWPANTVVLFEHANLADENNYRFLCDSLIAKIRRFLKQTPVRPGERYLYCCAMNNDLDRRVRELLAESDIPSYVGVGDFEIPNILETLDAHFNIVNLQVIAPQRYPDIVRFHYSVKRDLGLQELCTLLADSRITVIGSEDEKREFIAVGILTDDNAPLAYAAITPRASVSEQDLEEFARHARLIRKQGLEIQ